MKEKSIGTNGVKKWVNYSNDISQLYGVDIGNYPEHHLFGVPQQGILQHFPLYVSSGGYDLMCHGVFRQRKNSDVCSFELVTEGEILYESEGSVYHCKPGDLFIMHLHTSNRIECMTPFAKTCCIGFDGEQLVPILKQLGFDRCDVVHLDNYAEYVSYVERLSELVVNSQPNVFAEMAAIGYRALLFVAATLLHTTDDMPLLLNKIIAYQNSNLSQRIRVEDLARRFNVSQGTIFRLFMRYMKCAPNEYLLQRRIEYAKCMLTESNYTIKEISSLCGFCNPLYFSKVFRERNHISPGQFRKLNGK